MRESERKSERESEKERIRECERIRERIRERTRERQDKGEDQRERFRKIERDSCSLILLLSYSLTCIDRIQDKNHSKEILCQNKTKGSRGKEKGYYTSDPSVYLF